MAQGILLTAGVLDRNGEMYVLCVTEACDEDEAILARAFREGNRLLFVPLSEPEEFVGLSALPLEWHHVAAALTAEGKVYLADGIEVEESVIPEAGTTQPGALGLGRMTALKPLGVALYALGYGGQVFRRGLDETWTNLAIPLECAAPWTDIAVYAVAEAAHTLYAGGTRIATMGDTPEIDAAFDAGNAELVADLILDASRPDSMAIFAREKSLWRDTGFDLPGLIAEILPAPDGGWLVFGSHGIMWHTPDFEQFDERIVLGGGQEFFDIKRDVDNVFIMINQNMFILEGGLLIPLSPPLPPIGTGYVNFSVAAGLIAAFHPNGVSLREGERGWTDLVAEPFS